MITVQSLSKSYAGQLILDNLNFELLPGEITGLLGNNGSGKSTLLRILATIEQPDAGRVLFREQTIFKHLSTYRSHMAFVPEVFPQYNNLLVSDVLNYHAALSNERPDLSVGNSVQAADWAKIVAALQFEQYLDLPVGALSKGYRQRLQIAAAVMKRPAVLLLDEPATGLDPRTLALFKSLILGLLPQSVILFSSHQLSLLQNFSDRIIMLGERKILHNQLAAAFKPEMFWQSELAAVGDRPDSAGQENYTADAVAGTGVRQQ